MFVSILKGKIKYDPIIKKINEDTVINFVLEPISKPNSSEVRNLVRCSININNVENQADFEKGKILFIKGTSSNISYNNGPYTFHVMVNYYEVVEE